MKLKRFSNRIVSHEVSKIYVFFWIILMLGAGIFANQHFVPGDFGTIQGAINGANTGDEIVVLPGIYRENINFNGKNIMLRSTDPKDTSIVASTIIDGENISSVITFSGTEPPTALVAGFTIENGGNTNYGGGINGNGTQATIKYNRFKQNAAFIRGGGISDVDGLIKGNTISKNFTTEEGSGIYDCDGIITENIISDNNNDGLYICHGTIRDNYISGNVTALQSCSAKIVNNYINDNSCGMDHCWNAIIENNVIEGNSPFGGIYYCKGLLVNNTIRDNYSEIDGGGISKFTGDIKYNRIWFNYSEGEGGGIAYCSGNIQNNLIQYNGCFWEGGGISHNTGNIRNNIISHNISVIGGGISSCDGIIENNTIYANEATLGGALAGCNSTITNCIIRDNYSDLGEILYMCSEPSYSCIQDWVNGGTGNILDDPLFADASSGDFYLQETSPCIDAGNPDSQYNDGCLPPGMGTERNDMGAFGGPGNCGLIITGAAPSLAQLTQYGDVWLAKNSGAPPFETFERWAWLGFKFDPANGWYPLKGNADAYRTEDIIQVTEYGDVWVAISGETEYNNPKRWGWLGFRYEETTYNGWLPLSGDVDGTGSDDLIQITEYGDAWVALSSETMYQEPARWGWLGFEFSRGEEGNPGAIPLAGDANGDGNCDLIQITRYGDAWVATSAETMYNPPTRWGWLGFKYAPLDGWYPLCGDINADGRADLVQITPTGDPWISLSRATDYDAPIRWGWINFFYDEEQGYYPLLEDVNMDGRADLIQITPEGEAWVAPSSGYTLDPPENWGLWGFSYNREEGYLPFYLDY